MADSANVEFALKQYDELLWIKPNDIELWLGKAAVLRKSEDRAGELQCLEQALRISPHTKLAAHRKLELLVWDGRKADANLFYYELKKWDKQEAADLFYFSLMQTATYPGNSFAAANSYIDWALELWPKSLLTFCGKTMLYILHGKKHEAVDFCDGIIKKHPNEAWAWYLKGYTLNRLCEFDEAKQYFREAQSKKDKSVSYWQILREKYMEERSMCLSFLAGSTIGAAAFGITTSIGEFLGHGMITYDFTGSFTILGTGIGAMTGGGLYGYLRYFIENKNLVPSRLIDLFIGASIGAAISMAATRDLFAGICVGPLLGLPLAVPISYATRKIIDNLHSPRL